MGVDPDAPDGAVIVNGGFDVDSDWFWTESWSIHDSAAYCVLPDGVADTTLWQPNINFIVGNYYLLEYQILVWDTAAEDSALWIEISGTNVEVVHAGGVHRAGFLATADTGTILIEIRGTLMTNDEFVIDGLRLIPTTSYLGDFLGFSPARPRTQEVFPAVGADYYGRLNSWKDKSSCLFLFDL